MLEAALVLEQVLHLAVHNTHIPMTGSIQPIEPEYLLLLVLAVLVVLAVLAVQAVLAEAEAVVVVLLLITSGTAECHQAIALFLQVLLLTCWLTLGLGLGSIKLLIISCPSCLVSFGENYRVKEKITKKIQIKLTWISCLLLGWLLLLLL